MITDKIVVFSGPSGVGKATIEKILFANKDLKLRLSCSATTRKRREGEVEGEHYYFISKEEFNNKIRNNEFVEWNEHFSNKYGTLKTELTRIKNNGETPFIEVEPVGAKNIFDQFEEPDVGSFFISPPSLEELKERIISRGSETTEQIDERMERVKSELGYIDLFDYNIVNDSVEEAARKVTAALEEEA
ncbi:MAG: guanylate kinase [Mycoplasmataceae bacterium]|nr:guanylate kinase [Mycoplasmataceae bacterium]